MPAYRRAVEYERVWEVRTSIIRRKYRQLRASTGERRALASVGDYVQVFTSAGKYGQMQCLLHLLPEGVAAAADGESWFL